MQGPRLVTTRVTDTRATPLIELGYTAFATSFPTLPLAPVPLICGASDGAGGPPAPGDALVLSDRQKVNDVAHKEALSQPLRVIARPLGTRQGRRAARASPRGGVRRPVVAAAAAVTLVCRKRARLRCLHSASLHYKLQYIILYYITLHYTTLRYTTLHYTTLQ